MKRVIKNILLIFWTFWAKHFTTRINLVINNRNPSRYLEIGSGTERIPGFETLDIVPGRSVDYVLDCTKKLPFRDQAFDVIYASHVLEHVPWYMVQQTLNEWVRILKRGGQIEIWVPDAVKICKAYVDAELSENNYIHWTAGISLIRKKILVCGQLEECTPMGTDLAIPKVQTGIELCFHRDTSNSLWIEQA